MKGTLNNSWNHYDDFQMNEQRILQICRLLADYLMYHDNSTTAERERDTNLYH